MAAQYENHRIADEQYLREVEVDRSMWIDAETDCIERGMIDDFARGAKQINGVGKTVRCSEQMADLLRDAITDEIAGRLIEWACTRKKTPSFKAVTDEAIAEHVSDLVLDMIRAAAYDNACDEADRVLA